MHRLARILVTCTVLQHALLGCCWHHAHAERPGCCHDDSRPAATCDRSEHDHDCACGHSHPNEAGCGEGRCVCVLRKPPSVAELLVGADPLADAGSHVPTSGLATGAVRPPQVLPSDSGPLLRLHLLNQILLV